LHAFDDDIDFGLLARASVYTAVTDMCQAMLHLKHTYNFMIFFGYINK